MGGIVLPKAIYYADMELAETHHEAFSYLAMAADHYAYVMDWNLSYPEMGMAIQMQLQATQLDSVGASSNVATLYCMMELVALIHLKFPGDHQAKQRYMQERELKP